MKLFSVFFMNEFVKSVILDNKKRLLRTFSARAFSFLTVIYIRNVGNHVANQGAQATIAIVSTINSPKGNTPFRISVICVPGDIP